MNQENQNNKLNNLFIHDLYDNVGRAKRTLNNILESIEERKEEEGVSVTDNIILEITIEEIATSILDITHGYHEVGDSRGRASRLMEDIKEELEYSINSTLPYETTPLISFEYTEYENSMSEIIDLRINKKDIKESEHYNNVLDFLVKKIYIRGF